VHECFPQNESTSFPVEFKYDFEILSASGGKVKSRGQTVSWMEHVIVDFHDPRSTREEKK
jgi:hypothetical protein